MSNDDARKTIWGSKHDAIKANLQALEPDLADLIMRVAYDEVFNRPGLDLKMKELLAIAHLIGMGSPYDLKTHMYGALNCGASVAELKELLIHASMFCCFPKVLTAMKVLAEVAEKSSSQGDTT